MLNKFVNANNIPYVPNRFFGFDDVGILPYPSTITGSHDPHMDMSTRFGGYEIGTPIVYRGFSSTESFTEIAKKKSLGFVMAKNFVDPAELIERLKEMAKFIPPSVEIGTHPGDADLIGVILDSGIKKPQVMIVSPNGESQILLDQLRRIKAKYGSDVDVSVAFPQTIQTITTAVVLGANNIVLSDDTGQFTDVPIVTKIINARHAVFSKKSNTTISVAISNPVNTIKALVAGADTVMLNYNPSTEFYFIKEDMYMTGASKIADLFNKVAFFEKPNG